MFNAKVGREQLPVADWGFGTFQKIHVSGASYSTYDPTIEAMIKLLIAPRLEGSDVFCLYTNYSTLSFDGSIAQGYKDLYEWSRAWSFSHPDYYDTPSLTVVQISDSELFQAIASLPNDRGNQVVEKFFEQKKLPVLILNWTGMYESKHLTIFIERNRTFGKSWHAVASLISLLLPQYFIDKPLNEEEKNMLVALGTNETEFFAALNKVIEKKNYFNEYIKVKLGELEAARFDGRLEQLRRSVSRRESDLAATLDRISELYRAIEDDQLLIIGLEEKKNSDNSTNELYEYLSGNKSVHLVDIQGSIITANFSTYLQNFDPDMYERISKNEGSSLYNANFPEEIEPREYKRLLDKIFKDETYKLRIASRVKLGLDSRGSIILDGTRITSDVTSMPNPHLKHHNCFGNNTTTIYTCIESGDYVGAMAQILGSVGNMNFADGIVTGDFTRDLLNAHGIACIELPDGECVTPYEAIERIRNEQTDNAD